MISLTFWVHLVISCCRFCGRWGNSSLRVDIVIGLPWVILLLMYVYLCHDNWLGVIVGVICCVFFF